MQAPAVAPEVSTSSTSRILADRTVARRLGRTMTAEAMASLRACAERPPSDGVGRVRRRASRHRERCDAFATWRANRPDWL